MRLSADAREVLRIIGTNGGKTTFDRMNVQGLPRLRRSLDELYHGGLAEIAEEWNRDIYLVRLTAKGSAEARKSSIVTGSHFDPATGEITGMSGQLIVDIGPPPAERTRSPAPKPNPYLKDALF